MHVYTKWMRDLFSWLLSSIWAMLPPILIVLAVLWWIRKKVSIEALRKHHDVVGYTFSIVGVLYSVILGFTVVNVQEHYNKAEETVRTEATMIADLYRDASYFDDLSCMTIRTNLRVYLQYVLNEEWALPYDQIRRERADTILQNLWRSYEGIDLGSEKTKIWYGQMISKLDRLMDARLAREFSSWEHLSSMMWAILIVGAFVVVCFMFFFGLENFRVQVLITVFLTGYLTFILYLVYSLDYAFHGPMKITTQSLEETQIVLDRLDQQT